MKNKLLTLCVIAFCSISFCKAQGCSDAGFCTAGSIKPGSSNSEKMQNSVGISLGFGIGEQGTTIFTPQLEPQMRVNDRSLVQIKIPFVQVNGDLGKVSGLGDVILSYSYLWDTTGKLPLMLTVGTRIATGTASQRANNIPLPMPYQTSLGTTDLILGARLGLKKGFSISFAYQQPLFNRNQNGFDSTAFKAFKLEDSENYFLSSELKRKGDVLLRIDKMFKGKKTNYTLGVLPIFHLGKDQIRNEQNQWVNLDGSQGLTVNINGSVVHKLSDKTELSLIAGMPVAIRQSRPDGLTRAFVSVLGLRYLL
jgi:hypothetical protein